MLLKPLYRFSFRHFLKALFILLTFTLSFSHGFGFQKVWAQEKNTNKPKIYIAFHWHMHQPIYWPGETILETEEKRVYSYSLLEIHHSRTGPYTSWPWNAVEQAQRAGMPHAGAQVSFSGSLIENLNQLERAGRGFNNWAGSYSYGRNQKTALANPRLDLVAFGFHHPMMPLIPYDDIRNQIQAHRQIIQSTFGSTTPYSKGMFPPENAFADWMIPALVDEGIEWVFVDNIHFNRARTDYPWAKGENLFPPNPAEQRNQFEFDEQEWVSLTDLWAPSKVSAWGERPHWVIHRDPKTGEVMRTPDGKVAKMIAVPTERYLGNEDGRGGFGALNYEKVMSQMEKVNTDPDHPIILVLHHDGDNFGGGTHSYYHDNFSRFVSWLSENSDRFEMTTVQDYLDRFPPDEDDIIHVEPGSWSGADNGDPEFKKWFGDPQNGYSPDRNSWAVMTAAQNVFEHAQDSGVDQALLNQAKQYRMVSQTSCYEYWDGTEMWDSHPTRASNQMISTINHLVFPSVYDQTPPSILIPQREPYNPGGMEWGRKPENSDFQVWTYVFDLSGVEKVTLRYRATQGQKFPQNEFDFSDSQGEWVEVVMNGKSIPSLTNPAPLLKAMEYSAMIVGMKNALVSYQVKATDKWGNTSTSGLFHVYVGDSQHSDGPIYSPKEPRKNDVITIYSKKAGTLHWGVNGWVAPDKAYLPAGSTYWSDKKAARTPLKKSDDGKGWFVKIGPFDHGKQSVKEINFVFNYEDGSWSGQDTQIVIR